MGRIGNEHWNSDAAVWSQSRWQCLSFQGAFQPRNVRQAILPPRDPGLHLFAPAHAFSQTSLSMDMLRLKNHEAFVTEFLFGGVKIDRLLWRRHALASILRSTYWEGRSE